MGADIAQAATLGYLQCDIELEFMVMSESNANTSLFKVFARPNLMRAMVTLQLRHRYRMWRATRSRRLAVAMASHPRLGHASALRVLDTKLLMACVLNQ
jgi:hypothetical protein